MELFDLAVDFSLYTVAALRKLRETGQARFDEQALVASGAGDNVADETLDALENAKAYVELIDTEIKSRNARKARLATLTAAAEEEEAEEEAATEEPATEEPAAEEAVTAAAEPAKVPSVSEVAKGGATTNPRPIAAPSVLVASGDVPNTRMGDGMTYDEFTEKFLEMSGTFENMGRAGQLGQVNRNIAQMRRNYPDEFKVWGDQRDQEILQRVANEANLPGGSLRASKKLAVADLVNSGTPEEVALTAAGGWCAPSVTDYSVCFQTVIDGIYDAPEVQAPRGGVRHNTGLDWSTIYGGGNILASANGVTGFWNRTEAQIAAGSPVKDSIQVSCPSFTDTRLGVTGVWITSPILENRGYPEFVATFMRGAAAVHAHQENALQIQAVVSGSTAVTLSSDPYVSDGSVTSNLLASIEMAIVDLRYRLRMARNASVEIVLPIWVRAQFRADLSRRNVADISNSLSVADSQIDSWMAQRGANVQYVYDWQDAFTSATAGLPGNATAIQVLPATTQFLAYPSGTWVRAVQDVITLSAVYDSALLPTNTVTQLFMEDGWAMLQMCPVSRVYTVPTCPSGSTTAPSQVDCVTP